MPRDEFNIRGQCVGCDGTKDINAAGLCSDCQAEVDAAYDPRDRAEAHHSDLLDRNWNEQLRGRV